MTGSRPHDDGRLRTPTRPAARLAIRRGHRGSLSIYRSRPPRLETLTRGARRSKAARSRPRLRDPLTERPARIVAMTASAQGDPAKIPGLKRVPANGTSLRPPPPPLPRRRALIPRERSLADRDGCPSGQIRPCPHSQEPHGSYGRNPRLRKLLKVRWTVATSTVRDKEPLLWWRCGAECSGSPADAERQRAPCALGHTLAPPARLIGRCACARRPEP